MVVAVKEYLPNDIAVRKSGSHTVEPLTSLGEPQDFEFGLKRFLQEARTLAKFEDHDNIVRVRTFFRENGTGYLVMNFYEGRTLAEYLEARNGFLPEAEALLLMEQVFDGLSAVHEAGVLHRDIDPNNVYLADNGTVVLLDFGAARSAVGERTQSMSVVLKRGYAPHEQYHSHGDQGTWTACMPARPPSIASLRATSRRSRPPAFWTTTWRRRASWCRRSRTQPTTRCCAAWPCGRPTAPRPSRPLLNCCLPRPPMRSPAGLERSRRWRRAAIRRRAPNCAWRRRTPVASTWTGVRPRSWRRARPARWARSRGRTASGPCAPTARRAAPPPSPPPGTTTRRAGAPAWRSTASCGGTWCRRRRTRRRRLRLTSRPARLLRQRTRPPPRRLRRGPRLRPRRRPAGRPTGPLPSRARMPGRPTPMFLRRTGRRPKHRTGTGRRRSPHSVRSRSRRRASG